MKRTMFIFFTFFLSAMSSAQKSNLLICYKIVDNTRQGEIINGFSNLKSEYYLYSIQGNGKAINFYSGKKITDNNNLIETIKKHGFVMINIDSAYKIINEPSAEEEWSKQQFRKFTFLSGNSIRQKILDFECSSETLLDDLSDTIEVFSTNKLPKESSLLFFQKNQNPIIKIVSKNYEVYPESIEKIKFSFPSIENYIPGNLKFSVNPYQFSFEGGSEFPAIDRQIKLFTVREENYYFFDLREIKNYKTTILFFSRGFDNNDTSDSRLTQLKKSYQEVVKSDIQTITMEISDKDSVAVVFITNADKNSVDFDPQYSFLKISNRIKVIASATNIFKFYQVNGTPEVFIITNTGVLKDIYSNHFLSDNLSFEEFIKKQLE